MPTILIVDDIKINAMVVSRVLEEVAPNHLFATNGIEALEIFEAHEGIDLILMDIHMPQMNGLDAIDRIRATARYRLRPIPIIAITANALMEEKSRFLKVTGLTDYITKPVRKDTLLYVVRKHLPTPEEKSKIMKLFPFKLAVGAE